MELSQSIQKLQDLGFVLALNSDKEIVFRSRFNKYLVINEEAIVAEYRVNIDGKNVPGELNIQELEVSIDILNYLASLNPNSTGVTT